MRIQRAVLGATYSLAIFMLLLCSHSAAAQTTTSSAVDPETTFAAMQMILFVHRQGIGATDSQAHDAAVQRDLGLTATDYEALLRLSESAEQYVKSQHLERSIVAHRAYASDLKRTLPLTLSPAGSAAWETFVNGRFSASFRTYRLGPKEMSK